MRKAIVIGCPGSGKSCFSRALHSKTGIPLYHLDMLYWNADKTTVDKSVFLERLREVIEKEEWIIDGNYSSTMEERMAACDTIFFLDYPLEVCLSGVRERKDKSRSDMPWIENEDDEEFLEFIKSFNTRQRPTVLGLIDKYGASKAVFCFKSRKEADEFLEKA